MTIPWPPLNADDVREIARVHHGFLYQHVGAAHALVRHILGTLDIVHLVVERDEDLELHFASSSTYLQFKAREALQFSQISSAVLRLHQLRLAHETGQRAGACKLGFVLGGSLGPELEGRNGAHQRALITKVRELAASNGLDPDALESTWRSLVWSTPGSVSAELGNIAIRESAELALQDLEADVALVPGLAESPKTTALALVASIHALAADNLPGFDARAVRPDQVPLLVRTIQERAAALPRLPSEFVPLGLDTTAVQQGTATVLLGVSGSGKTTQLTWLALGEPNVLYARPSADESEPIHAQIVGQLVAALNAIDVAPIHFGPQRRLEAIKGRLTGRLVIIDNCHLISSNDTIKQLFSYVLGSESRLLLTGQPVRRDGEPTAQYLRQLFERAPRIFDAPAWTTADIVRYLARRGRPVDPVAAETLRTASGGHPLTVADIADISEARFNGDIEEAARSVRRGDSLSTLRAVTAAHFQLLPDLARRVAAVMATVRISLATEDLLRLLPAEVVHAGVSRLRAHRYVLERPGTGSRRLQLLEAYLPEAAMAFHSLFPVNDQRAIHETAATLVEERLRRSRSAFLVPPLFIHKAYSGHVREVVDELTSDGPFSTESLARVGIGVPLFEALEDILKIAADPRDRFFLRDAVFYLNEQEDMRMDSARLWQEVRSEFLAIKDPGRHLSLVFAQKAMRFEGWKDLAVARAHFAGATPLLTDFTSRTIFRGEFANALFHHKQYTEALEILRANAFGYLEQAGVDPRDFWEATPPELALLFDGENSASALSRLADTIEGASMTLERIGDDPRRLYLLAIGLYALLERMKAEEKATFMLLRQCVRDPSERSDAIAELRSMLEAAHAKGDIGKIIPVSTLLALAHELQGDENEAKAILTTLVDYDPKEIEDELALHRAIVRVPLRPAARSALTYLFMYGRTLTTVSVTEWNPVDERDPDDTKRG